MTLITPASVLQRLSVEALCETADSYYRSVIDPTEQMGKPFSNPLDAPDMLMNLGQLLSGLHLTKSMSVLDFAAGTCWLSRFLSQMQCVTISVDASHAALAIGRRLFDEHPIVGRPIAPPTFLHFNGRHIDLPDESVDRIVCFDAFHHIPNQREILAELVRVLKPGGIAGFSEPGRYHSQTAVSQYEMANFDVLENDLILEDVVALAYDVGFSDFTCKLGCSGELSLNEYKAVIGLEASGELSLQMLDNVANTMRNKAVFFLHKGARHLDSRGVQGQACEINPEPRTVSVNAGEDFTLDCMLRNTGQARWLHHNPHVVGEVQVGVHLYDAQGKLLNLDFGRSRLAKDVDPGEETVCQLRLRIDQPGRYRLAIDMVSEYVCWFESLGLKPVDVDVFVN